MDFFLVNTDSDVSLRTDFDDSRAFNPVRPFQKSYMKLVTRAAILRANRTNTTHITGEISLALPVKTFRSTQLITENMIPVAME
jgi:hypothetical protein